MRRRIVLRLSVSLAALALAANALAGGSGHPLAGSPAAAPGASHGASAAGRVLVRFRPRASAPARTAARASADVSVARTYRLVQGLELLRLPAGRSASEAVARLSQDPSVDYAVPDSERRVALSPNDPLAAQQWNLAAIGAGAAWSRRRGAARSRWQCSTRASTSTTPI